MDVKMRWERNDRLTRKLVGSGTEMNNKLATSFEIQNRMLLNQVSQTKNDKQARTSVQIKNYNIKLQQ
jgi:hypothetical protein